MLISAIIDYAFAIADYFSLFALLFSSLSRLSYAYAYDCCCLMLLDADIFAAAFDAIIAAAMLLLIAAASAYAPLISALPLIFFTCCR